MWLLKWVKQGSLLSIQQIQDLSATQLWKTASCKSEFFRDLSHLSTYRPPQGRTYHRNVKASELILLIHLTDDAECQLNNTRPPKVWTKSSKDLFIKNIAYSYTHWLLRQNTFQKTCFRFHFNLLQRCSNTTFKTKQYTNLGEKSLTIKCN